MHGLIFLELQKFARQQAGAQAWEILLRETRLPLKSYSVVSTYPDEDLLALVGAASRLLNLPAAATLEAFGEFIAPELMRLHGRFLRLEWKTLDVIENTEQLIHAVVRVGNGDAKPPVLDCIRTTPDELQLLYTPSAVCAASPRGLSRASAATLGRPSR